MVWSVPLVPAKRIGEPFVAVEEVMTAYAPAEQQSQTQEFLRYLANLWGRIPEILSVAGHTPRTNNICEGYNQQLPGRLGGSCPKLTRFLNSLGRIGAKVEAADGGSDDSRPVPALQKNLQGA
ncbi:hypothetical protein PV326_010203, partial [Microctonus aethiopoides]